MKYSRTFSGFLIAPLWVLPAMWGWGSLQSIPTPGPWPAIISFMGVVAAYAAMLVLGLPMLLYARARGWTSWRIAAAAGFTAGAVTAYLSLEWFWLNTGVFAAGLWDLLVPADQIPFTIGCGLLGMLVSSTFWLIARPDKDDSRKIVRPSSGRWLQSAG